MAQVVLNTEHGWMIRCQVCGHHYFPKDRIANKSQWSFNGNMERPTFTPSMNEHQNPPGPTHNPELPTRRCHYIVTDGRIAYCGDCTHELAGQTLDLIPFSDAEVRMAEVRMQEVA